MKSQLFRQLNQLAYGRISPRPAWVAKQREILLAQVRNTVAPGGRAAWESVWTGLSIFLPQRFVYYVLRPVAVLVVVALVGASSLVKTVDAAYEALPGDVFYPAKRGLEKTQAVVAALIGNPNAETKLHMQFATRRATETVKIIQRRGGNKDAATAVVKDLQEEMKAVNAKLSAATAPGSDSALQSATAKEVSENSAALKDVLKEVKNNLLNSTTTADTALSKEVQAAKGLAQDATVKAVEVMVTNNNSAGGVVSGGVTAAEVQQALNTTIANVATDASESKQTMDGAKIIVAAAKSEAKELLGQIKTETIATTTAQVLADKLLTTVSNQTVAAVLKSEVVAAEVSKNVFAAQEFSGSGNFAQAVDKLKQASDGNKEAEKISDAALIKAQLVLPAVTVASSTSGLLPLGLPPAGIASSTN